LAKEQGMKLDQANKDLKASQKDIDNMRAWGIAQNRLYVQQIEKNKSLQFKHRLLKLIGGMIVGGFLLFLYFHFKTTGVNVVSGWLSWLSPTSAILQIIEPFVVFGFGFLLIFIPF
jgi:hypothetical protein